MKRIIDFCKQKYKILIPVMVVFVLLITVYFLYREYKYDNYRNKEEISVFQYFGGVKTEYTAIVTYNLKKTIVDVTPKDEKILYDATPIYYKNDEKMIFPKEMNAVFPLEDGKQYRVYKYSLYDDTLDLGKLSNGIDEGKYNNFFLYDGEGLYFFSDEVSLKIDGKEYVKLSANSYVDVDDYTLVYYDKENDKSELLEIEGKKITATSDKLDLCLNEHYFMLFGERILLTKPYNLNSLFK